MIVRNIKDIQGTERDVTYNAGRSFRLILQDDNMGFSFSKTLVHKGEKKIYHYTHHLESCFCIAGQGILTDLATGETHTIEADTIYILDKHDRHQFEALTDVVLLSVFNPPLKGGEVHNKDGSYTL